MTEPETIVLVLATHNRDKVAEIQTLLSPLSKKFALKTLDDFPGFPEVDETEPTLEGNALKKAREIFLAVEKQFPEVLTLSDDTGLEVRALNGAPGVRSARYAAVAGGEKVSYADNVQKLLREMTPHTDRKAQFRTVVALAGRLSIGGRTGFVGKDSMPPYFERTFEGVATGSILNEQRGTGGFGYDSVFLSDELHRTFAEVSGDEKAAVSHRGKAVRAAASFLTSLFLSQ